MQAVLRWVFGSMPRGQASGWRAALRHGLAGAFCLVAIAALATAAYAPAIPDESPFGVLARIFETFIPHLFIAAGLLGLAVAVLGARALGLLIAILAAYGFGDMALRHYRIAEPLAHKAESDLRVIFFNILQRNFSNGARIADAVIAAGPDIVVFAESAPLREEMEKLEATFPYRIGCAHHCELVVLSRHPIAFGRLAQLGRYAPDRFARVEIALEDGREITLIAGHMTKPWFHGVTRDEQLDFARAVRRQSGPTIVVGDFNAVPWSRPMRYLFRRTDLVPDPVPVPTWPAGAGMWGLPIDHVMVQNGARLISVEPFGEGLGSNHRGLLAEIALPN